MRWPWRRRRPAVSPNDPSALAFDASVDIAQPAAVATVRSKLRALPGAGWISVEAHAGAALAIRLFPSGTGIEGEGAAWITLRRMVEREVWAALETVGTDEPSGWAQPEPMQAGFAETMAPSQFEALEQLASMAKLMRTPPAPAPSVPQVKIRAPIPIPIPIQPPVLPEDAEDVARLSRLLGLVLPAGADPASPAAAGIRRFGSYAAVLAAPETELRHVPGFGTHSIAAVKLVHAAAVRLARAGISGRPVLADRKRLNDYLAAALARERVEQFRILFLDDKGMLRADEIQAQGTVNHTPVYPREVVRRALALEASSLVLVHNHPSGDPSPSRDDIEMTKQVREAAAVMKIGLRDHVIVGNGRWLSFRDEGYLD